MEAVMRIVLGAIVLVSLVSGSVQAAPCDGVCVTPTNPMHRCGDYTLLMTAASRVHKPARPQAIDAARKANEDALKRLKAAHGGIITDLR